jgi:rSAM/selenodomain-associated transferase 1
MNSTERIILFLKTFQAGRVKTRLASSLGDQRALKIYTALVAELLTGIQPIRDKVIPYFNETPQVDDLPSTIAALLDQNRIRVQRGDELGVRMSNAFQEVFSTGAKRAVLIGSDVPRIDSDLLKVYLEALHSSPMVLGPAGDGGYYLIGFQRDCFDPTLFSGIEWSTERVCEQTLEKARSRGLSCYVGRQLQDVDTVHDLEYLLSAGLASPSLEGVLVNTLSGPLEVRSPIPWNQIGSSAISRST